MYVWMYVCMYVCIMYVYIHIFFMCTYIFIYIHMYMCIYTCTGTLRQKLQSLATCALIVLLRSRTSSSQVVVVNTQLLWCLYRSLLAFLKVFFDSVTYLR